VTRGWQDGRNIARQQTIGKEIARQQKIGEENAKTTRILNKRIAIQQ
jgi:hypothetical protein